MTETGERFNVFMFFPDGTYHQERTWVTGEEAVKCAFDCTRRPAVLLGMIRRVIITDANDFTCFEWKLGQGVTFPTREQVMFGGPVTTDHKED